MSILDVINKAINDLRLACSKDISLLTMCSQRVHFPGVCCWKGQMFFARVLRFLHPLVKKEISELTNMLEKALV